ncbi:MAG: porin family protein [Alphaproteobacteria bacterium]|nr:porin family protein [Alphaproteobacteria bacterium]
MKFLKLFFLIIFFTQPTKAFSRTSGNYVGVDFIKTSLSFSKHSYYKNYSDKSIHTHPTSSDSFGLKYSYAFNYKNFFIAPGLIFELNNTKNNLNLSSNAGESELILQGATYSKIHKRYGAKIDIGFDFNDYFSAYSTYGYAINYFTNYSSAYYDVDLPSNSNQWFTYKSHTTSPFIGAGLRIKINGNWLINAEYNHTRFTTLTNAKNIYGDITTLYRGTYEAPHKTKFDNIINIIKLGVNYAF